MCPFDLRDDFAYEGGAFRSALSIGWAAQVGAETCRRAGDADRYTRLREIAHQTPERLLCDPAGPEARALLAGTHYARWLDEPAGAEYWTARSPKNALGTARVPMLVIGGWFDVFLSGTLDLHARNRACAASANWRPRTRRWCWRPSRARPRKPPGRWRRTMADRSLSRRTMPRSMARVTR
jgi:predicted acyl esterase